MEKIAGIIVNDPILQWQSEAIDRIESCGFKLVIFSSKTNNNYINFGLKLLFFLEAKILNSSKKYLRENSINSQNSREQYFIKSLEEISSLLPENKKFAYFISLIPVNEKMLVDLSVNTDVPVLHLSSADAKNIECFPEAISSAYRDGKAVFEINLYLFVKGKKSIQYTTKNSIETGLVLKSINAILAKCSLIIPRFLNNNTNVGNVDIDLEIITSSDAGLIKRTLIGTFIYHLFDKIYYKRQWIILYQFMDNRNLSSVNSFYSFLPPKDRFYADPFIVNHLNQQYIFFEELDFKSNKGYISFSKFSEGVLTSPCKAIESKYHMSFPNIFEYANELYMIPETLAANNIQLWHCISFPDKWQIEKILIDSVRAVDSIVKEINGKWWLFCSIKPSPQASGHEELYLYYSDNPLTDKWIPHTKNPVMSDARLGRNAGQIEYKDGKYYRYGQFSGNVYGKAITKSEIIKISEEEYQEKMIDIIFPDNSKGFDNLHTFNFSENLAVSDALRRIRRFF